MIGRKLLLTLFFFKLVGWVAAHPNHQLDLTYTSPGSDWLTESLPIGNGYFGALVLTGIAEDRLRICDPLFKNDEGQVQPLADLVMTTGHDPANARTFLRRLDLQTASVDVSYRDGRLRHKREYFASHPHRVLVGRLRCVRKGSLNLTFSWKSIHPEAETAFDASSQRYIVSGKGFEAQAEFRLQGGMIAFDGQTKAVSIAGADEVAVILTVSQGEMFRAGNHLDSLEAENALTIYQRHLPDYQDQFHGMYMTLEGGAKSQLETAKRRQMYAAKPEEDPGFEELLFQYGRYLFLSSWREGSPVGLTTRGIWWFPSKEEPLDNRVAKGGLYGLMESGAPPTQLKWSSADDPMIRVGYLPWLDQPETALGRVSRLYVDANGGEPDNAYANLRRLLQSNLTDNLLCQDQNLAANMALVRGVCDLFAFEKEGQLHLGDHLPKHWSDGSVVGLLTPNYELAYVWQSGAFLEGYLTRLTDGDAILKVDFPLQIGRAGDDEAMVVKPDANGVLRFPMKAEQTLQLRQLDETTP